MRFLAVFALAGLLAGCYSEEQYSEDYNTEYCRLFAECTDESMLEYYPYTTEDECIDYFNSASDTGGTTEDECEFDSTAAQDCVAGMQEMTCDDYNAGSFPSECTNVCG